MKIPIDVWAARNYSEPPSHWVLGQWRRTGQILPAPERVGRKWFVEENARRIVGDGKRPRPSLVDQIDAAAAVCGLQQRR